MSDIGERLTSVLDKIDRWTAMEEDLFRKLAEKREQVHANNKAAVVALSNKLKADQNGLAHALIEHAHDVRDILKPFDLREG